MEQEFSSDRNPLQGRTRRIWDNFEDLIEDLVFRLGMRLEELFKGQRNSNEAGTPLCLPAPQEDFVSWGKSYIFQLQKPHSQQRRTLRQSLLSLLRSLGVSESLLHEVFVVNRGEMLEQLLGETIAVFSLLFAWNKTDQLRFSQVLGEIGVAAMIASNPVTGLIAVAGLAVGFNKMIHPEAIKKGGLIALTGLGVSALVPGGFVVSFVAALTAVVLVNRKISTDRKVEDQIKEYWERLKPNVRTTI